MPQSDRMGNEFKEQSILRIRESQARIAKCLSELSDGDVWKRPNPSSNSTGNLVLHLIGNVGQWIQSGLAGLPDRRDRDAEFKALEGADRVELAHRIDATIDAAVAVIRNVDPENLLRIRKVQGFEFSGIGIIIHVTEHLSYHTGQMAFWIKLLKDKDLGFYKGVDLNARSGN